MNLIDVSIVEILEEPKQIVTDELCCWEVKVKTSCYGSNKEKVFRSISKSGIDKYKVGYTWME